MKITPYSLASIKAIQNFNNCSAKVARRIYRDICEQFELEEPLIKHLASYYQLDCSEVITELSPRRIAA